MFDGCELQLDVELEPLGEGGQGQEGTVTEATGLQLTELKNTVQGQLGDS